MNASAEAVVPVDPLGPDKGTEDNSGRRHGRQGGAAASTEPAPAPAPALREDAAKRFRELIEDVTDQLMLDQSADRDTCRADAITLLIDAARQCDEASPEVESPLTYLLLEEQQKARTALRKSGGTARPSGFIRA
jgi:hypothetical protein